MSTLFKRLLVIMGLYSFQLVYAGEVPARIPAMANIGAGYADYRLHNGYDGRDSWVTGTQLSLRGVVEKDVLEMYKHKVPAQWRKMVASFGEVSITHSGIPKTLYIHPYDGEKEAYGATWGITPGLGMSLGFVKLNVSGGVVATYLYQKDAILDKTSHLLRPGLRGTASARSNLFTKYLALEAGILGDVYWPGTSMFGKDKVYRMGANFLMLHIRVPISVKAPKA